MEFEFFRDSTFFNEKMKIPKGKPKNVDDKKCRKKSPSSATPVKGRPCKSVQKENLTPEKLEEKTVKRMSGREPLKVLNKEISTGKRKSDVSPGKIGRPSKAIPSPSQPKVRKENVRRSTPKIIIVPGTPVKKAKKVVRKTVGRQTKSWDGSELKMRESSGGETKKSSKTLASQNEKHRHSFNDLGSIKSPNKKEKPEKVRNQTESTPTKGKSILKPGQPGFEEMFARLETLFPNVDPEFLKSQFVKFKGSVCKTIECIIMKEKTNELPTRYEYNRRTEAKKLEEKFWENFSVEKFVEIIPDPWEYFLKTEKHNCVKYVDHSLHYLKNKYKKHYVQAIQKTLSKCENSLYLANKELKKKNRLLKMRATNRSKFECDTGRPSTFVVQFLYEVAFIENESKIKSHIKKVETAKYKKFKEAEQAGALLGCQSCNDFSLLPDDAVNCPANHVFCKDCVVKYVEVEMGKDNFRFKCLFACKEMFSVKTLRSVLNPLVMARILERNQLEEIKSAGIEDLVFCPFCYFVIIMPPEISVFKCLNPCCMIESCRYCKQLNHIPLKCNELEKFETSVVEEVQEEEKVVEEKKETDESIYSCAHCKGKFKKTDDPDRMICPCGTSMCCICEQLLSRCSHANTQQAHPISSSDDTDYAENLEETTEGVQDGNSDAESGKNFLEFLPSNSDAF